METRPSVPPYSSITSAMWVRVVCMRASRSMTGIEGGAKITGRRILASLRVMDRSMLPSDGTVTSLTRRRRVPDSARATRKSMKSRMWTMPLGSSSVSP